MLTMAGLEDVSVHRVPGFWPRLQSHPIMSNLFGQLLPLRVCLAAGQDDKNKLRDVIKDVIRVSGEPNIA